jgi:hypothetical protein
MDNSIRSMVAGVRVTRIFPRIVSITGILILAIACGRAGVTTADEPTPSPSETSSASPSPDANPTPDSQSLTTYVDPKGRFSFSYPSGWQVSGASDAESYSVTVANYDINEGSVAEMAPDRVKIEVGYAPAEQWEPLRNPQRTNVNGQPVDYVVYRQGDREMENFPGATLYGAARLFRDNIGYGITVITSIAPPDPALDQFWKTLSSLRIGVMNG